VSDTQTSREVLVQQSGKKRTGQGKEGRKEGGKEGGREEENEKKQERRRMKRDTEEVKN
jgi:hypothetical protein